MGGEGEHVELLEQVLCCIEQVRAISSGTMEWTPKDLYVIPCTVAVVFGSTIQFQRRSQSQTLEEWSMGPRC